MNGLTKGTKVKWSSSGGTAHGHVLKKLTSPTKIKGYEAKASSEDPQILVETENGAKAAHKPEAIKKEEDASDEPAEEHRGGRSARRSGSSGGVKKENTGDGEDDSPAPPKKKKKTLDYIPTVKMAENAKLGLELREKFRRGGTEVGVNRAHQLSERRRVSVQDIKSMASYFARHEVDKNSSRYTWGDTNRPSAGFIAWLLWGGEEGKEWAQERREALRK